jgi:hypothetical protein
MACPSWEVVCAPHKKGKDQWMIVCFCVADIKDKVPAGTPDRIHTHLESMGHQTLSGYISYNGLVDITLTDTCSIDSILATSSSHFPKKVFMYPLPNSSQSTTLSNSALMASTIMKAYMRSLKSGSTTNMYMMILPRLPVSSIPTFLPIVNSSSSQWTPGNPPSSS